MPYTQPETWKDYPDGSTPLSAAHLNAHEAALAAYTDAQIATREPLTTVASAGTLGSTWTPALTAGVDDYVISATLGANLTLSPPASPPTVCHFTLVLTQDATGGRMLTLSGIKSASGAGVTLSTAAAAKDILLLYTLDGGTTWVCAVSTLDVR